MTQRNAKTDRIMVVIAVALLTVLAVNVAALYQLTRGLPQPIAITACKPDTDPCIRWFSGQKTLPTDQAFRVVGEVCNTSDKTIAYTVDVAWESVGPVAARFPVLTTPVNWDPGCMPYDFPFVVPEALTVLAGPGESLGLWKLVGAAVPADAAVQPYRWSITRTVEIVAAG